MSTNTRKDIFRIIQLKDSDVNNIEEFIKNLFHVETVELLIEINESKIYLVNKFSTFFRTQESIYAIYYNGYLLIITFDHTFINFESNYMSPFDSFANIFEEAIVYCTGIFERIFSRNYFNKQFNNSRLSKLFTKITYSKHYNNENRLLNIRGYYFPMHSLTYNMKTFKIYSRTIQLLVETDNKHLLGFYFCIYPNITMELIQNHLIDNIINFHTQLFYSPLKTNYDFRTCNFTLKKYIGGRFGTDVSRENYGVYCEDIYDINDRNKNVIKQLNNYDVTSNNIIIEKTDKQHYYRIISYANCVNPEDLD